MVAKSSPDLYPSASKQKGEVLGRRLTYLHYWDIREYQTNDRLISKETVMPRRWGSETLKFAIK